MFIQLRFWDIYGNVSMFDWWLKQNQISKFVTEQICVLIMCIHSSMLLKVISMIFFFFNNPENIAGTENITYSERMKNHS